MCSVARCCPDQESGQSLLPAVAALRYVMGSVKRDRSDIERIQNRITRGAWPGRVRPRKECLAVTNRPRQPRARPKQGLRFPLAGHDQYVAPDHKCVAHAIVGGLSSVPGRRGWRWRPCRLRSVGRNRRFRRIRCLLHRFDCYRPSAPSQAGLPPATIHAHSRRTDTLNQKKRP